MTMEQEHDDIKWCFDKLLAIAEEYYYNYYTCKDIEDCIKIYEQYYE